MNDFIITNGPFKNHVLIVYDIQDKYAQQLPLSWLDSIVEVYIRNALDNWVHYKNDNGQLSLYSLGANPVPNDEVLEIALHLDKAPEFYLGEYVNAASYELKKLHD